MCDFDASALSSPPVQQGPSEERRLRGAHVVACVGPLHPAVPRGRQTGCVPHAAPLFDFWELFRQMAESEEGGRGDHRSVATPDSGCG